MEIRTRPGTFGSPAVNETTIGALKRTSTVSNYFSGSIDDAALYGASLTAAQVTNHYQAGKSNYAGTVTGDAPGVYWRLGETSGTVATDTSNNGQTGTYTPAFATSLTGALTGDSDKAITFNGSTQYVSDTATTGTAASFSMEAWIKTGQTSGTTPYFIGKGSTSSVTPFEGLTLSSGYSHALFTVRDNSSHQVIVTGTKTVNDSAWHHLVGVRDTVTNNLYLYVDGTLDGTTSGSTLTAAVTTNTTTAGALKRTSVSNFAPASIDEAAYYPTALDATTVAKHYYNGKNSIPTISHYAYNGDGTRASKNVDGNKTPFTWDTAEGLPLMASDGTNQYIYGPGGSPVEQVNIATSTPIYYHQDQQGSTRALTDQSGNLLGTYTTDAFGNPSSTSGATSTPLRYDGEYRDAETGFIYLRARYYDPLTGGFLTRDPADAVTRSAYGFAVNDPLNSSDPTGLAASYKQLEAQNTLGAWCDPSSSSSTEPSSQPSVLGVVGSGGKPYDINDGGPHRPQLSQQEKDAVDKGDKRDPYYAKAWRKIREAQKNRDLRRSSGDDTQKRFQVTTGEAVGGAVLAVGGGVVAFVAANPEVLFVFGI